MKQMYNLLSHFKQQKVIQEYRQKSDWAIWGVLLAITTLILIVILVI